MENRNAKSYRHARARCYERYGLPFTRKDEDEAIRQIRAGKGLFVRRKNGQVTIWNVSLRGETVTVMYHKRRGRVLTVLPPKGTQWV